MAPETRIAAPHRRTLRRLLVPAAAALLLLAAVPVRAQVNDDCASARSISTLPFTDAVDTSLATTGGGDPFPSCAGNDHNVWYTFTAAHDTTLEITTAGSGFDTNVSVYTGACGSLTEIACNEDTPSGTTSQAIVPMNAGETVRISVAASGAGGPLQLLAQRAGVTYLKPEFVTEAILSSDPSPLGGSFGAMVSATAITDKAFGFAARTEGIFARLAGLLTTIATSGAATPAGGTFATFGNPSMNQATTIAFQARIDGGPAEEGIFLYAGGVVSTVALLGDPSPDGGTYRKFGRDVVINEDGNIAFLARTSVGGGNERLLVFDGITTTIMAAEGDPAPCGGTIRRLGSGSRRGFDLSDTGIDVVYLANAGPDGDGIYTSDGVAATTIRCAGDPTALGGTHRELGAQPTINSLGEVYFASTVSGIAIDSALWRVVGGAEAAVITTGVALATGETVDDVPTQSTVATNGAGDVAFFAELNGFGRSVVLRPAAAPLPSSQVRPGGACPFGGTFRTFDDDLDLAISGGTGFGATCDGGSGTLFVPAFGAPIPKGRVTDATALGTGFSFRGASPNAFAEVAFHGGRVGLYGVTCPAAVCGPVAALIANGAPVPGFPGHVIDRIDPETFNGIKQDQSFTVTIAGPVRRGVVVTAHGGALSAVASTGQTLPGGVGSFAEFPLNDGLAGSLAAPATSNNVTAFFARVTHPTATQGIFAATPAGTTTVALEGDPAPSGDVFTAFGAPFVHQKSIVFEATTGTDTCVYATKRVGLPVVTVACEGDPVPSPIGGTLGTILAPPSGSYKETVFAADVSGGTTAGCVFSRDSSSGKLVPLLCVDDPFVNGQFVTAITGGFSNTGPVTERKGANLSFAVTTDVTSDPSFAATVKTKRFPLFENFTTVLPVTGGTVSYNGYAPLSTNKKTVAFAADLSGGTASGAVVVGRMK